LNKLPNIKKPEGRKELAQYLCQCIEAGKRQQGNIGDRWARLEAMAKQTPTDEGSLYDETTTPSTFPLLSPKIDQLVGAICGPVLSARPYFTAIGYGASTSKAKKGSDVVQFLMERMSFDRFFRVAVRRATTSEPAIVFCYFDEDYADFGPKADVIHPKNFIIYPAYKGGIKKARVCADRYYERLDDLKENEAFFEERKDLSGGDRPDDQAFQGTTRSQPYEGSLSGDQPVECWRVIAKFGDEYHLCRVAFGRKILLSCEPYAVRVEGIEMSMNIPFLRPGYFEVFLQESEENEFLREVPVAHKMQSIQLVFDKLLNCMVDGTQMNAATPIIATGAIGDAGKLIEYEPGSIISMPGNVSLFPVPSQFNSGQMPQLITLMSELADAASRVSQAGQGQQFSGNTTATEVSGILQGQRMGLDEYRSNSCQGMAELCAFLVEMAQLYFVKLIQHYGDDFPAQSVEEFAGEYTFEPTGKTEESTPGALIEKTKLAMEMTANMVAQGMLPPQLMLEFYSLLIKTLKLPMEDHVIEQYIQLAIGGVGAGVVPQPGMGPGAQDPQQIAAGLLNGIGSSGPAVGGDSLMPSAGQGRTSQMAS